MLNARNTLLKSEVNSRRSQRVIARIHVLVRRREDGESSPEAGHTLVVNAHGALIGLEMKVEPNEFLSIKNAYSGEEKNSRVIQVREETGGANEVAIEFTEPAPRFWHIEFPPADWVQLQD